MQARGMSTAEDGLRQQLCIEAKAGHVWRIQVRGFPCTCAWPALCDSQGGGLPPTRMQQVAAEGGVPISGPEAGLILAALKKARSGDGGAAAPAAAALEEERTGAASGGDGASPCRCEGAAGADSKGSGRAGAQSSRADGEAAAPAASGGGEGGRAMSRSSCMQGAAPGARNAQTTPDQAASTSGGGAAGPPGDAAQRMREAQLREERRGSGQATGASGRGSDSSRRDAELEAWEAQHVHGVYDVIASHFSATRFAVWPKVTCCPRIPPCVLGAGKQVHARGARAVIMHCPDRTAKDGV